MTDYQMRVLAFIEKQPFGQASDSAIEAEFGPRVHRTLEVLVRVGELRDRKESHNWWYRALRLVREAKQEAYELRHNI